MKKRIFILDDNADMVRITSDLLSDAGYLVTTSSDPRDALKKITADPPDMLLLDIQMPEIDGLEVCKTVKSHPKTAHVIIIMLSVKTKESDIIVGLELGADDYIRKPIQKGELLARVKTVFRRMESAPEPKSLIMGPLRIDFDRYQATVDDKPIQLTPKEFELLSFFMRNEGRVLTRNTLAQQVWGTEHVPTSQTIEFHVHQLRRKLGRHGESIQGLKGVGYRFEVGD